MVEGSTRYLAPVMEDKLSPASTPSLSLCERVRKKIAAMRWMAFITTCLVFVFFILFNSSISLIGVFFPIEVLKKDVSLSVTGVIIAVNPLAIMIFSPVIGYLLPKLRITFSIITGLLLVGGTYILLGLTIYLPSGWPFIIACIALKITEGIGGALVLTAGYTVTTKLYPYSTGTVMGIVEIGASLGYAFGPVLGGFLYKAGGYKLPFFTVGGMYFVLAFPMFLILMNNRHLKEITKQLLHLTIVLGLMKNFTIILLLLGTTMFHAGFGFVVTTYSLFLYSKFGLTPEKVGLIFLVNTMPAVIANPIAGLLADRINPRYIVIFGMILSGLGFQIAGPSPILSVNSTLWMAMIGIMLTEGGAGQAIVAIFVDTFKIALDCYPEQASSESERTKMMGIVAGMLSTAASLGLFAGPAVGGGLTDLTNFRTCAAIFGEAVFALAITLLAVTAIDYCFNSREKKYYHKHSVDRHKESTVTVNSRQDSPSEPSTSTNVGTISADSSEYSE